MSTVEGRKKLRIERDRRKVKFVITGAGDSLDILKVWRESLERKIVRQTLFFFKTNPRAEREIFENKDFPNSFPRKSVRAFRFVTRGSETIANQQILRF